MQLGSSGGEDTGRGRPLSMMEGEGEMGGGAATFEVVGEVEELHT